MKNIPWPQIAEIAYDKATQIGARAVFVDTLPQFAGLKGEKENNSGDALEAMQPIQNLAAQNLAVLYTRHERKGGGEVGESGRGSSAWAGAADILLTLRRPDGNQRPTLRVIESLSRFDETPQRLMVDRGFCSLFIPRD